MIDGQCRVEVIPDSQSKSPLKTPGSKHHSRFQLFASQKTFEFQATDHRNRLQWVNAIKTAIENAQEPSRYQRALLDKRKLARAEEKEREEEEDIRKASHADSLDQTKLQLEHEKQVSEKFILYLACRLILVPCLVNRWRRFSALMSEKSALFPQT